MAGADENVTQSYGYDAFGVQDDVAANDSNPWRYAGEFYDVETDSYYLRNRYYDPAAGQAPDKNIQEETAKAEAGKVKKKRKNRKRRRKCNN